MRWSKLKKEIEGNFAPALKGRVEVHSTRYRGTHDEEGRAWITVDKEEMLNMCTVKWEAEYYQLRRDIEELNQGVQPEERECTWHFFRNDSAHKVLKKKDLYSQYEFTDAAWTFLNLPIDAALKSENKLIQALAILDRRVGKRTLKRLQDFGLGNALLEQLYQIRCEAEGIEIGKV